MSKEAKDEIVLNGVEIQGRECADATDAFMRIADVIRGLNDGGREYRSGDSLGPLASKCKPEDLRIVDAGDSGWNNISLVGTEGSISHGKLIYNKMGDFYRCIEGEVSVNFEDNRIITLEHGRDGKVKVVSSKGKVTPKEMGEAAVAIAADKVEKKIEGITELTRTEVEDAGATSL